MSLLKSFLFITVIFIAAIACVNSQDQKLSNSPIAQAVSNDSKTSTTYNISLSQSELKWKGASVTGSHDGIVNFKGGTLHFGNNGLTGGKITVDMPSLIVTDLQSGQGKEKLEGHLKASDFFDVEQYPTSVLEKAKVEHTDVVNTYNITANLTIKGQTNPVEMTANIQSSGDEMLVTVNEFEIDRTKWGIQYSSGIIGTAKDKLIYDEVQFEATLTAKISN